MAIARVAEASKSLHQLFMVSKRAYERGGHGGGLEVGDIVLTFNDKIISKVTDLDVMYDQETLHARVVRGSIPKIEGRPRKRFMTTSDDPAEGDRELRRQELAAKLAMMSPAQRAEFKKLLAEAAE